MHTSDLPIVSSHTDKADKAGIFCLDNGFQCTFWAHRQFPFIFINQAVELQQIHMVGLQAIKRPLDISLCLFVGTLTGLCGQKELLPVMFHPWAKEFLRPVIVSRRIDVVDTVFKEGIECAIHLGLGGIPKGCGSKYGNRAFVSCISEWLFPDHAGGILASGV
jgi:hypothetical protein